jgi:hypothetical protein
MLYHILCYLYLFMYTGVQHDLKIKIFMSFNSNTSEAHEFTPGL